MSKKSKKSPIELNIVDMPKWKSKVLNAVAWILGLKGEKVYLITISDLTDKQ